MGATTTQWVRLIYGPGQIEARMKGCDIEYRSLATGEPCPLDEISAGILIEDNRRSVCIDVVREIARVDEDLRYQLSDPTVETIDYSYLQLQGKAAVILLTAARAYAGDHGDSMNDLTRTTWTDLVQMIPTEGAYEA